MWNETQVKNHLDASKRLAGVLKAAILEIKNNADCTEYEISQFILNQFKTQNLRTDKEVPIVAFRENTSFVHYYPKQKSAKKLQDNTLILIDLWARLKTKDAPYSDITWMAYRGKTIPPVINEAFFHVKTARDKATDYLKNHLKNGRIPTGMEMDNIARSYLQEKNLHNNFLHSTGHSIGHFTSPHGRYGHLRRTNASPLSTNLGYTVEPGLYFEGQFGVRSEIDFIIQNGKLKITTPIQDEIEII